MRTIQQVVRELTFHSAIKKSIVYEYEPDYKKKKPNTYSIYLKETPFVLETKLQDGKETTKTIHRGDFIMTGIEKEQWSMDPLAFFERYNVVDGSALTKPIPRKIAIVPKAVFTKLNLSNPFPFEAPWKETMLLKPGDVLVKDDKGYYRIEKNIFYQTYILQ
jgi:hypothetical protein